MKDFIAMASPLGVTHMMLLSQTDDFVNMRIVRLPRGPTLSFHVRARPIAMMRFALLMTGGFVCCAAGRVLVDAASACHPAPSRGHHVCLPLVSACGAQQLCGRAKALQGRGTHPSSVCFACVLNQWMPAVQIVSATIQHMFPAIDVATIKLAECRRVVLVHLHKVGRGTRLREPA